MSAKTQTHPLLVAHSDAITAHTNAGLLEDGTPNPELTKQQGAGIRAGLSRKIADLELELTVESIPFDPWSPPRKTSAKKPTRNDAELMARIDTIRQIRDDGQHPQSVRDTAARHFDQLVRQATARGLLPEETPTEETPELPKSKGRKSAGDKLAKVESDLSAKVAA